MNLLVIDPDPQLTEQVRRVLGDQHDITIESAGTGTDAWMILGNFRHRFDAVILELALPDMDGTALLARMRGSVKHRDTAVLICSSRLHRDVVARVITQGVRHFVVKPASDHLLLAKLAEVRSAHAKSPVS